MKERTAYHEAGHFMIAYILEQHIPGLVTIKPDKEQLGHVSDERDDFDPESSYAGIKSARAYAIECYAGYAAEVRFDPTCTDQSLIAASSDYEKAADAVSAGKAAGLKETEETLRDEAAWLVEEHWIAIDALAKELIQHETIEGEEAGMIIDIARGLIKPQEL